MCNRFLLYTLQSSHYQKLKFFCGPNIFPVGPAANTQQNSYPCQPAAHREIRNMARAAHLQKRYCGVNFSPLPAAKPVFMHVIPPLRPLDKANPQSPISQISRRLRPPSTGRPPPHPFHNAPSSPERLRRGRTLPPRSPAVPRATVVLIGSASSSASSQMSHASSGALQRRRNRRLLPSAARISGDPVLPPTLPRPRLRLEWIRCEPLLLLLCSPPPFSPPSPISHRGREFLAAGHGVAVATATAARSRAHRRAHHSPRST